MLLLENEEQQKFEFDVYSCYDKEAENISKKYKHSNFIFIRDASIIRFFTNVFFKLKIPVDLSNIPLPISAYLKFKKTHYDLVYIVGYIRGALRIINLTDEPTIVHHHVVTDLLNEKSIRGREIVDSANKICFVSEFAANVARTGSELQNKKMINFPNSIEISRFENIHKLNARKYVRDKYKIEDTDIVIIFVGRLVENKGALELIQAFNACKFESNVKFMIVGGATYSSKKNTTYVKKCIDVAMTNPNVILTGYVDYNDIPQYYHAADIGTLVSLCDEACGLVGIESMAAGIPVITTDRGGIREYVDEKCKIVVREGECLKTDIIKAFKTLVENTELRKQMGIRGEQVARKFDRKHYYQTFVRIVEDVLEGNS